MTPPPEEGAAMTRVVVERRTVGSGIPILRMLREDRPDGPLVIAQHGLRARKEGLLELGLMLAEIGYVVVLPDARMHGERYSETFEERLMIDLRRAILEVVDGTAGDISEIIDAFASGPAAMIGISMGSFILYHALTHDRRIGCAVSLIGGPEYVWPQYGANDEAFERRIAEINPASHPERFAPCALLIQHGEEDEIVSIEPDRNLYERLRLHYAAIPDRLGFVAYAGVGHDVTPEMIDRSVEWLRRFLPPA